MTDGQEYLFKRFDDVMAFRAGLCAEMDRG